MTEPAERGPRTRERDNITSSAAYVAGNATTRTIEAQGNSNTRGTSPLRQRERRAKVAHGDQAPDPQMGGNGLREGGTFRTSTHSHSASRVQARWNADG